MNHGNKTLHPHVFGDMKYASEEELREAWNEIKNEEKAGKEWQEKYLKSAFNEASELITRAEKRKGFKKKTKLGSEKLYEDVIDQILKKHIKKGNIIQNDNERRSF